MYFQNNILVPNKKKKKNTRFLRLYIQEKYRRTNYLIALKFMMFVILLYYIWLIILSKSIIWS